MSEPPDALSERGFDRGTRLVCGLLLAAAVAPALVALFMMLFFSIFQGSAIADWGGSLVMMIFLFEILGLPLTLAVIGCVTLPGLWLAYRWRVVAAPAYVAGGMAVAIAAFGLFVGQSGSITPLADAVLFGASFLASGAVCGLMFWAIGVRGLVPPPAAAKWPLRPRAIGPISGGSEQSGYDRRGRVE